MRILLIVLTVFFCHSVLAADIGRLLQRAQDLQLARQPQWLALLHYKDEVWSTRVISQVDDTAFFLSPQGKTDATAELLANIRAFLQSSHKGHAQCLFPARWYWLKQQLSLDQRYDVACPQFEKWAAEMPSDNLTLVFPAMYLNNPGSSFGHTFLRFDDARSPWRSRSLNYAASYQASDSLVKYVYNGLFGGYRGVFTLRRYFETEHEYSDLEQRDIWEYRLSYTPEEIRQLIRHVWEVMDVNFDYFFFTENCSYRLLALLDVLRPDSQLTSSSAFPLYAIPVDTVRALQQADLISTRKFRPSLATRIRTALSSMAAEQRALTLALAQGRSEPSRSGRMATLSQQLQVLDTAYKILQFNQQQHSERAQAIVSERDEFDGLVVESAVTATASPPELGHGSARIGWHIGRRGDEGYMALRWRPAFHDLLDAPQGYTAGAAINIFQTEIRLQQQASDTTVSLQQLQFIHMESLSAVHDWYRPWSWLLAIQLQNQAAQRWQQIRDFLSLRTTLGGGVSFDPGLTSAANRVYALALLDVHGAGELEDGYAAQAGLRLGWLHYAGSGQIELRLQSLRTVAGHDAGLDDVHMQYQYNLTADSALRVRWQKQWFESGGDREWSIGWLWYF